MDSAAATEPWASKIGDATDTLFEGGERGIIAIPVRRTSDRVLRTWALRHVGDTGLVLRLLPQDGFLELLVGASPISCVEPGAPPFLLVQGDRDALVPHSQTDLLAAALADSGV